MSINSRESKQLLTHKAEPFAAYDLPEISPETIQRHIAEGHRLRAEMMNKLIRKAFASIARPFRRTDQAITGRVHNRSVSSLAD